ncbi:37S ribosomal protein NAM9 like [Verticillium longisporum]|nr:37S ribosomal protein NAM9 like [Verticillium longisporum]
MTQLATILKGLNLDHAQQAKADADAADGQKASSAADAAVDSAEPTPQTWEQELQTLTKAEQDALARLLAEDAENPVDETKPYLTPWQPRRYIAPFAFIPRYLEVNQNICAAVYLRHPVARRGEAEVPTPFPIDQNQLAFNWYLRRR